LAWTRLTNWRIQLAAALDQMDPSSALAAEVEGVADSPSPLLMAAWLNFALDVPVKRFAGPAGSGLSRVSFTLANGGIQLLRSGISVAELSLPGQPIQRVSLPRPSIRDCLAEELRRLDPDEVFECSLSRLS
ncbi:glucose-6-phosphate dehydrogenase assembly protein OpcA, partial [Arthrobacter sp. C152]